MTRSVLLAILAIGGMALAACASGGGASPRTGPAAEALFAGLTGTWVLDKTSSRTPRFQLRSGPRVGPVAGDVEQARREAARMAEEEGRRMMAVLEPVYTVFPLPSTLILRMDEERLVFVPTPGHSLELPMSGEWIEQTLGGHSIRTRVDWEGDRLALELQPRSGGQVRVILGIEEGRLQIAVRIRVLRTTAPPWVLVYDRDEGGK